MHPRASLVRGFVLAACLACLSRTSFAEVAAVTGKNQDNSSAKPPQAFTDAQKLRADAAAAIANQTEKPAAAILRLKALGSLSGMPMDAEADFAFAMVDIGQRLIAFKKATDAEAFFVSAENTLAGLISRTPDKEAQTKAMFLQQIGFIRGHYLNEAGQATKDLAEAVRLQPDDIYLRRSRDAFASEHAAVAVKK